MDWGPYNNPFEDEIRQILAVALGACVYLQPVLSRGTDYSVLQSPSTGPRITAINFDRSSEAMATADESGCVTIWDVAKTQKLRVLKCHARKVNSISWNRSPVCPYLLTSGSSDTLILNHDLRVKNSVVNMITQHEGEIC